MLQWLQERINNRKCCKKLPNICICICICVCICICKNDEILLEFTRQAPLPPPLPVALQTTCFLDSQAFPKAPYFLRAPWEKNSLCWSIRFRYWSEFMLNIRPSMKVKKNISQFCIVRSLGFVTSSSDSSMYGHILNILTSQTGKQYLDGLELFWDGLLDGWLWPSSSTRWGATLKFVV